MFRRKDSAYTNGDAVYLYDFKHSGDLHRLEISTTKLKVGLLTPGTGFII